MRSLSNDAVYRQIDISLTACLHPDDLQVVLKQHGQLALTQSQVGDWPIVI